MSDVKSDLEIAQEATMQPIGRIAESIGIPVERIEPYGHFKAKLPLDLIDESKVKKSKLVLVTAISPTPAGEGKTTTSIGLTEGLNKIGKKTAVVLREPSLGPVFGMKGGAAGGGYAQVVPMEDINLHFTGDFGAIEKSNNLLSSLIDNNLQNRERTLGIDPRTIAWKRVIDMNDRALRNIAIGLGGVGNGIPREDGFNITAASEVMAILCMATDLNDLKNRLASIYVGQTFDRTKNIYARDLNAQGAMALLLKDAIKPNLVQTLEGNPAIIHGGPFANIAQGTNSIIGTKMGMSLSDIVVTEAGFGADLGAEKFFDIKCRAGNLKPEAVVLVATIKALRFHGGVDKAEVTTPNLDATNRGLANLGRHIENIGKFGLKPVVAINHFPTDTDDEIKAVKDFCLNHEVEAVVAKGWAHGGEGMTDLAEAVVRVLDSGESDFRTLYDANLSVKEKIKMIAMEIYRADGVTYSPKAESDIRRVEALGLDKLPVCLAKTQYSFSDDPKAIGAATGFEITVNEIEIAAGAGFIVPILGKMMRMPGLPKVPAAEGMDIDSSGKVSGLS